MTFLDEIIHCKNLQCDGHNDELSSHLFCFLLLDIIIVYDLKGNDAIE